MSNAYIAGLFVGALVALLILGFALMQFKRQGGDTKKFFTALTPMGSGLALTPITMYQLNEGRTVAFWFCVGVQVLSILIGMVNLKKLKAAH